MEEIEKLRDAAYLMVDRGIFHEDVINSAETEAVEYMIELLNLSEEDSDGKWFLELLDECSEEQLELVSEKFKDAIINAM